MSMPVSSWKRITLKPPGRCCSGKIKFTSMLFKKHILESESYRGGSTRAEGDKKIFKLSSNENPIGPSPQALDAISKQLSMLHEYAHQDDSVLRTALASHLHCDKEQFICANI